MFSIGKSLEILKAVSLEAPATVGKPLTNGLFVKTSPIVYIGKERVSDGFSEIAEKSSFGAPNSGGARAARSLSKYLVFLIKTVSFKSFISCNLCFSISIYPGPQLITLLPLNMLLPIPVPVPEPLLSLSLSTLFSGRP